MAVEVRGLADIVREAKNAIRTASDAAAGMRNSANELTSTVAQVLDMQKQLDSANADLRAAVGAMSNGGDQPESSSPSLTLNQATNVVAEANK
jgi:prophage DNA circulation protein